jgi:two-component system, chemotaxis family, chemotaxis protein CheY
MGTNVLIVDDSQTMRKVIRKSVVLSGFEVGDFWEAGNGKDALTIIHSQKVDVILTDLNMPEMNGLEMFLKIQQEEKYCHIPVIFITSQGSEAMVQEGLQQGVQGYIQKPFHPEAIRDVLLKTIGKNHD